MAKEQQNGPPKQPESADQEPGGKRFFNMTFKMSKKSVDQTEMTLGFKTDVEHYDVFDGEVTKTLTDIESIFLPIYARNEPKAKNDIKLNSKEDAFVILSSALNAFRYNQNPKNEVFHTFATNMKSGAAIRNTHIREHLKATERMRRFHYEGFKNFADQKKKFDDSKLRMDTAKTEVSEAKTTAQIEKKALCYQMAVDDFDIQTDGLIKQIDLLPSWKNQIAEDIVNVMEKHRIYHENIANCFQPT